MKKFAAVFLVTALLLGLASCDQKTADTPSETSGGHEGETLVAGVNGDVWVSEYDDVDINPYDPALFTNDGNFISYSGDPAYTAVAGIDVSQFQGSIDWDAVRADGVRFVILRLGYRGWGSAGTIKTDDSFRDNYYGAKAAGLRVGAYFYSQAMNDAEAVYEAEYALNELNGLELDLPVFFDWENTGNEGARTEGATAETVNSCSYAFCKRIEEAGRKAGVYFYQDLAYNMYNLSMLKEFCIWHSEPGSNPKLCYAVDIWQYSYSGRIGGINSDVDMNLWFIPSDSPDLNIFQ